MEEVDGCARQDAPTAGVLTRHAAPRGVAVERGEQ